MTRKKKWLAVFAWCWCFTFISGLGTILWSMNKPPYKFDIRTNPEWQKIFYYSWEHSKPEAAKELLGVWEVEEYWIEKEPLISRRIQRDWRTILRPRVLHEKEPLISHRIRPPRKTFRQFLIFERERFAVVDYNLWPKVMTWSDLGTPVYGLDGERGLRVFSNTLDKLKESPVAFQEGYGISSWKIQDDTLYYYEQNGGKRQSPIDVPERPCKGIWRMARRVDASNDDLGICQIDPAELPTGRHPVDNSEIPPHVLDILEGREKKTPPPPIDPNGTEGQFASIEELRGIPGFEDVANAIDNTLPESPDETPTEKGNK